MTNPIDGVFDVMVQELGDDEPIVLGTLAYARLTATKFVDYVDLPQISSVLPKWGARKVFWSPDAPSDPKQIIAYSKANARKVEAEVTEMLAAKGVVLP